MNNVLKSFLLLVSASHAFASLTPNGSNNIELSNDNTNQFICQNGYINDVIIPQHIPHEINIIRENIFLVYKMKRSQTGITYVDKSHSIHIVCAGEVYSINATQKNKPGNAIQLGSSDKATIEKNASKLQEMSIEDIMVEMFLSAYNNDLPPNYDVKHEIGTINVADGITVTQRRSISLNGVGLKLNEYTVTSDQTLNLYKETFMKKELSQKMRSIAIVPEKVSAAQPARLFIIEDK